LFQYLRLTPDARCLLVVDEVDDEAAEDIRAKCDTMPPGVGVIMIGIDASGRAQPETIQVEGLSQELMERTIQAITPGLPADVVSEIASACERSPKLAVLIANRINQDPSLISSSSRLKDRRIQSVLDRYLNIADEDIRALSVVALVNRVGWLGDVEQESVTMFTAQGMEPIVSRQRVEQLHERYGVAPLAGRFRYISPGILGDHLAARYLKGWTANALKDFIESIGPSLSESFSCRIRHLAVGLENRGIVESAILGDQGPFQNLHQVEQEGMGALLHNLSGVFPHATLRALDRIIGTATDEQLRDSTSSRREMVWALEVLLWREDTFEQASRLILRLAMTENETWSNSATGLWTGTFQTMLGHTAAGLGSRLRVLKRAMQDKNPESRRLAAVALEHALKTEHISRFGNPPTNVPGMPDQEWQPKTYGEWGDAIRQYLALVGELLNDEAFVVRLAAANALAEALNAAMRFPDVLTKWVETVLLLTDKDYAIRSRVAHAIDKEITRRQLQEEVAVSESTQQHHELSQDNEDDEVGKRFRQIMELLPGLLGNSFSSRLRWLGEREPWHSHQADEAERRRHSDIETLAQEAISDPFLMNDQWEWLLHNEGTFPEELVRCLGRLDFERKFASRIDELAEAQQRAVSWASIYEIARAEGNGHSEQIDDLVDQLRHKKGQGHRAFDLLLKVEYSHRRLAVIRELFVTGEVEASKIDSITWSTWRKALTPAQARDLVSALLKKEAPINSLISFLDAYLHDQPAAAGDLRDTALDLLRARNEPHGPSTTIHESRWERLAMRFVQQNPYEVGQACLNELAKRQTSIPRGLTEVLQKAWQSVDKTKFFLEVLEPWLDMDTIEASWVCHAIERLPLGEVGVSDLFRWVSKHPEVRARRLAKILRAPSGRPSDVHAMLLTQFEDQHVGNVFYGAFISGSWSGPSSVRTRKKIEEAKAWLEDEREVIREWATTVIHNLERQLEANLSEEAEERFR